MPYDQTLATNVRTLLGRRKNLTEKKMFGGVGFLLGGNICCGVWKDFLILRLGEDAARQVLAEEHARPFDITGRPMRGWAMIEPDGWRDAARLRRWIEWATEFTGTLPAK
ncbi:MAG: TfoX/Sxy family protein [Planctomycetes bacterium]|nr:TfoX/Sxy family protein [Planctomycetota bacterium]